MCSSTWRRSPSWMCSSTWRWSPSWMCSWTWRRSPSWMCSWTLRRSPSWMCTSTWRWLPSWMCSWMWRWSPSWMCSWTWRSQQISYPNKYLNKLFKYWGICKLVLRCPLEMQVLELLAITKALRDFGFSAHTSAPWIFRNRGYLFYLPKEFSVRT